MVVAEEVTFSTVCYGDRRNSQGTLGTDRLFTGQRLDDTGLYYYGARYYDASIGRFISADPIVSQFANPQAFNRYSYVLNNPLRYTDPTGLYTEEQLNYNGIYGWNTNPEVWGMLRDADNGFWMGSGDETYTFWLDEVEPGLGLGEISTINRNGNIRGAGNTLGDIGLLDKEAVNPNQVPEPSLPFSAPSQSDQGNDELREYLSDTVAPVAVGYLIMEAGTPWAIAGGILIATGVAAPVGVIFEIVALAHELYGVANVVNATQGKGVATWDDVLDLYLPWRK